MLEKCWYVSLLKVEIPILLNWNEQKRHRNLRGPNLYSSALCFEEASLLLQVEPGYYPTSEVLFGVLKGKNDLQILEMHVLQPQAYTTFILAPATINKKAPWH